MGFNLAGAISGFINESHKVHAEQVQDEGLKLKQGAAADAHSMNAVKMNYYKALTNYKTGGGSTPYQQARMQRMAAATKHSETSDKLAREKFEFAKANPKGPKGAISLDPADDAVRAAQDRVGGQPTQGAIPGMNGAVRPWPGDSTPAVGGTPGAQEPEEEEPTSEPDDADEEGDDEEGTQRFAAGGLVQKPHYAEGGALDTQQLQQAGAQPAIGGAPAPAPQPQQQMPPVQDLNATAAQSGSDKNDVGFDAKEVLNSWKKAPEPAKKTKTAATDGAPKGNPTDINPVRFGLSAMQSLYQASNGASALDAGHAHMAMAVQHSDGAMTDKQYDALGTAVDPNKQLSTAAGLIARLDATTKSSLARGDYKSAQTLAHSLLMYGKVQSETFGNKALGMLKTGDLAGAGKMLERAYEWSPDGGKLTATVGPDGLLHAQQTSADGKTTDLGAFSAQNVFKFTLGVASGGEYMKHLAQVASGKVDEKPAKEAKPMAVPKLGDRKNARQAVDDELVQKVDGKDEPKWPGHSHPEFKEMVASIGSQIHASNDADPAASLRAITELTNVTGEKTYKMQPNPGGGAIATLADGSQVKLSTNTLAQLGALITKKQEFKKKADDKAAVDKETETKASALEKSQADKLAAKRKTWQAEEQEQERKKAEAERPKKFEPNYD